MKEEKNMNILKPYPKKRIKMSFSLEVNERGKEHEQPRAISKDENKKENVKIRTVYKKLI